MSPKDLAAVDLEALIRDAEELMPACQPGGELAPEATDETSAAWPALEEEELRQDEASDPLELGDFALHLQAAAMLRGPEIRLSEFLRSRNWSPRQAADIKALWTVLRQAAGLGGAAPRADRKQFTRDDLLAEFDRVQTLVGRPPTFVDLDRHASIGRSTFQSRFGNMPDLRMAHRQWVALRDRARSADPNTPPPDTNRGAFAMSDPNTEAYGTR